jgi:hypothetical protein
MKDDKTVGSSSPSRADQGGFGRAKELAVLRVGRCRRAGDGLAAPAAQDAARKPRAAVTRASEPLRQARRGRAGHAPRRLPRASRADCRGRAGTPGALHAAQGPRTGHAMPRTRGGRTRWGRGLGRPHAKGGCVGARGGASN